MQSNKEIPDFQFDEEKIKFLLDNTDQLISLLTKEQINLLVDSLKENHDKIEETIEELKKSEDTDNNNQRKNEKSNIRDDDRYGSYY